MSCFIFLNYFLNNVSNFILSSTSSGWGRILLLIFIATLFLLYRIMQGPHQLCVSWEMELTLSL